MDWTFALSSLLLILGLGGLWYFGNQKQLLPSASEILKFFGRKMALFFVVSGVQLLALQMVLNTMEAMAKNYTLSDEMVKWVFNGFLTIEAVEFSIAVGGNVFEWIMKTIIAVKGNKDNVVLLDAKLGGKTE